MQAVEIRWNKALSVAFLVIGVLSVVLNLFLQQWFAMVVGVILAAVGAAFLAGPALIVKPDQVELKNAFQMTVKKVPIHGFGDLRLDDKTLYRLGDGRKIRNLGFGGARPEDLETLRVAIAAAQGRQ